MIHAIQVTIALNPKPHRVIICESPSLFLAVSVDLGLQGRDASLSDLKWRIGVGMSMISHSVPSSQPAPYQFFPMHAAEEGFYVC